MSTQGFDLVAELNPLGGLERWLHDPAVAEVLVNGNGDVWVERDGRLHPAGRMRTDTVLLALERILVPIGRRLDRSHPAVDARLADGSRVCAVIPPVAVDGPSVAIRRFRTQAVPLEGFGNHEVATILRDLVTRRCNVVVSGATSAGKTTLLNALAAAVPPHERIITLEDIAELRLDHPHVVRLETREPTPDGVDGVDLAHLLRTALRLRPDRLVVGEIRGEEAVHLLQALNTGHDGSLATVHANGPLDALERLSSLVLQTAASWPWSAIQRSVVRAIDVVVHVERSTHGHRRVHQIVEVTRADHDPAERAAPAALRFVVDGGEVVGQLAHRRA